MHAWSFSFFFLLTILWAGQRSRYNDRLRGWTVWGSNPRGVEIFRTCPDRSWNPPNFVYKRYRVFPGVKERPGRDADPSPPSSAVVMKEQSYTSTPPMGRTACTELQCLYKGALYLYFTEDILRTCGLANSFVDSSKGSRRRREAYFPDSFLTTTLNGPKWSATLQARFIPLGKNLR